MTIYCIGRDGIGRQLNEYLRQIGWHALTIHALLFILLSLYYRFGQTLLKVFIVFDASFHINNISHYHYMQYT
jgi:hypothetical protein